MTISDIILNLDLKLGEQHRGNCPICLGHNTFTVTKTVAGTLFNCYKAGCRLSGRKATSIRVSDLQGSNTPKDTEPFTLPKNIVMGHSEIRHWLDLFNYPFHESDLYYDLTDERIVFPVRYKGEIVDATGKSTSPEKLPKWKRYGTSGYAYTSGKGKVAVVVEDAISAAVIAATDAKCTGVALLGTSLLDTHVEQLQAYTGVIVVMCLLFDYKTI